MHLTTAGARALLGAGALFCALVIPIGVAGASDETDGSKAKSSATKKIKKLSQQVQALQQQVDQLEQQPGPQGPQGAQGGQGPAGTAPACQGNGSTDKMVAAGSVCIDRYEASIWDAPTGGNQIPAGSIPCNPDGHDCNNIYARSVAGVTPISNITYFQAQQALANSGKRLPTNAEWQQAVAGTPDPGASPGAEDCHTTNDTAGALVPTGSRDACISNHGANDMIGNLSEWVADWDETATGCTNYLTAAFGFDLSCVGDDVSGSFPGALLRGGNMFEAGGAGAYAIDAQHQPTNSSGSYGFRGAR